MRARLHRHIHSAALCGFFGAPQRFDFRMRTPTLLGPATRHDVPVFDNHRTDCGIRPGTAEIAPSKCEGETHKALVVSVHAGDGYSLLVHLRAPAEGPLSSSPDNSSSAARKSLASRKLR